LGEAGRAQADENRIGVRARNNAEAEHGTAGAQSSAMKKGQSLTRHDVVRAAAQLRRIDEATADILVSLRLRGGRRQW
jgi:hypothetical protein